METSDSFGVIIDMKDLQPSEQDVLAILKNGQKLYKDKGMNRSAAILNSSEILGQFKMLAVKSGIYKTERYIDASSIPNPTAIAIAWVKYGIDPDK